MKKQLKRKVNVKFVLLMVVAVLVILGVVSCTLLPNDSYEAAYKKTGALKSYEMQITTMVTIDDGENTKQSFVDQTVYVENKGKGSMRYKVDTVATSSDTSTDEVKSDESNYVYSDGKYYYSYPGVSFASQVAKDRAKANIDNLTNVIAFPYEKMLMLGEEKAEEGKIYYYEVNYEDISEHVSSTLQSAINTFEGESFSPEEVSASATVKSGYVISRDLCVIYEAPSGKSVMVEVYTNLVKKSAKVEKPDESKYVMM